MPPPLNYLLTSTAGSDLLQIQSNRFMHNWRKNNGDVEEYPRFENIVEKFSSEITKLDQFYQSHGEPNLRFNQAEIAYHNTVYLEDFNSDDPSCFLNILSLGSSYSNDFNLNWRETITNSNEEPVGRLHVSAQSGVSSDKRKAVMYSLVVRGRPEEETFDSCLSFLKLGRSIIINKFESTTTSNAHLIWKKHDNGSN